MKDAQKPDHVNLNGLLLRLNEGRYVIPDFQREFEWQPWDIRELIRSIFLDYYIGSLLLWKGTEQNFAALSCEPIHGYAGENRRELIVLDGQQRLTALYYAFFAPDVSLPGRAGRAIYYIKVDRFMSEEYDNAFHYEWANKKWERLMGDAGAQYRDHVFPLPVVGSGGWDLYSWVQGYERYWRHQAETSDDPEARNVATGHADRAVDFGEHVKGITEQYQISYIELDRELAVDKVCDIFTQINSRGVRLDVFDLINALLKPKGVQLKQMWRAAAPRLEFVDTGKMNVYILQVMSILRQAYCSPKYLYYLLPGQEKPIREPDGTRRKEVLVASPEDFEAAWDRSISALEFAIHRLRHPQEFGSVSSAYVPYVSILPVFAALQDEVRTLEAERRLEAQRKVQQWYWASVFMSRYSGSVESTSARDYLDVRSWIRGGPQPEVVRDWHTRFRDLDLRRETKRGSSIYNGIFNMLVLREARDWVTGTIPQHGDLDDHHIVPASWGAKNLATNAIHSILNRSPLTSETNRNVINDRLPNTYLPDLVAASGAEQVRAILHSHFISQRAQDILMRQDFGPDDFEEFLDERRATLINGMESLLIKERVELPVVLRRLDEDVESIELGIRSLIAEKLDGDSSLLPDHVRRKTEERIAQAAARDPTLDSHQFSPVAAKLEFCDLRELHDIIVNKATWQRFEDRFGTKEALSFKFGQLADMRNAIRHSRSLDDVVRKEGEAAVMWFNKALPKPHPAHTAEPTS
jgi:hypothetical protein